MTKFGPWDDRNYALNRADLALLAPNEERLYDPIPAFFRVELRREFPHLQRSGSAQYPRAAVPLFYRRYTGLLVDGRLVGVEDEHSRAPVPVNGEVKLNTVLGANEVTIEINPVNPQQVIAGSNNNGGQEMYYSTDGGENWTIQGVLSNTCCDPTIDWSPDGETAYAAALSGSIGVSFWRSTDGGQTWIDRVDLTPSGSDKEFIHVDRSPSSAYEGNVYLTYHDGNVMQFARSQPDVNGVAGDSFDITAFSSAPVGIGSDITTTSNGDIYYFYGATSARSVTMLRSTDGGDTFESPVTIATTLGQFDFPIPAMETRRAWIYTAAGADRSGGDFDDSVYVAFTDTAAAENESSPGDNHTIIEVGYSRDGGQTWQFSNPHPTDDTDTVDRFNQWLTVDESGAVHVVYYDTRNSANRTGVDLYYTFSIDGGVTWNEPERVTPSTSTNLTDLQEWGDYNGISVLAQKAVPVWTDNRDGSPNSKDVYAADLDNLAAAEGFFLQGTNLNQSLCAPGNLDDIALSIGQVQAFTNPVTLSYSNLPAGFSGSFTANPVAPATPAAGTTAQIAVDTSVAGGDFAFDITGTAASADDRALTVNVTVFDDVPGSPTLMLPADGAQDQTLTPTFSWTQVSQGSSYVLEIDDDPGFGSIEESIALIESSVTLTTPLDSETTYYWRVRAVNDCGDGTNSATRTFTTGTLICSAPGLAIPDESELGVDNPLVVSSGGAISDLDVSVLISHTYVGDISVSLTNLDSGTSVSLINRPGVPAAGSFGCSNADIAATLDDDGTAPVEDACSASGVAIEGVFTPEEPLAAFFGEPIAGTWVLNVSDAVAQDTGTLDQWCLIPVAESGTDTDMDGIDDALDNCPDDSNAGQEDFDGDDLGDVCDPDDDNDGTNDDDDDFPFDPEETNDNDGDTVGDNADPDDDNDGQSDVDELACLSDPLDEFSTAPDLDGDNIPDCVDLDDDGDGQSDADELACSSDPLDELSLAPDLDGDDIPDCVDLDDDGDGQSDADELACSSDPNDASSTAADFDSDGSPDCTDTDDDNDGVDDGDDAFPFDPDETNDADGDKIGDNADPDDDNDQYSDTHELACGSDPLDMQSLPADFDLDLLPDCADIDDDNDGIKDTLDDFPFDPTETNDNDDDGVGDNADPDDDNDGQIDLDELACQSDPLDAASLAPDFDEDNSPDCVDDDDDNDGTDDEDDDFPFDPDETNDNDGDTIGDNADPDDDNDGQTDLDELACQSDPLDELSIAADFDTDNLPDCVDTDDDNDGQIDLDELACESDPLDPLDLATDDDADGFPNCMILRAGFE